jgi:glycosyltransferase involved in cell wall biosynthesis
MAIKVCQLCAVDFTLKKFLLPLIDAMIAEGWKVTSVCSHGPYVEPLRATGYDIQIVPIARTLNLWTHLKTLVTLTRLFRRESFDILHAHTPVAALLGRVAARIAGVPVIVYTSHGFYFHDRMSRLRYRLFVWLEWIGGRFTDLLFTQSGEDAQAALRHRIVATDRVVVIGNGVSVERFDPARVSGQKIRDELGIPSKARVVGIVGRLVPEKGYEEFFEAAGSIAKRLPETYFLVVGDRLTSDRGAAIDPHRTRAMDILGSRLVFTGMREDIPELMAAMDLFCLPSYREGMPRTIIEAMMMAKPVVATNIRGSREEVVEGVTGRLVPVGNAAALEKAICGILTDSRRATEMGRAGRERALKLYDERNVVQMQIQTLKRMMWPAQVR